MYSTITPSPKNYRAADWYPSAKWCLICISLIFKHSFGQRSSRNPTIQSQVPVTFTALTLVSTLFRSIALASGPAGEHLHGRHLHLDYPWTCPRDTPETCFNPTDTPHTALGDDHLVIFGGMGYADPASEDLCVLSDVRLFSLSTLSWLPVAPVQTASDDPANPVPTPRARYAHLSSVTASKLFIIGGQDLSNVWLDDIHVYDLPTATWVMWRAYPRHCGTYRSVAVCAARRVRSPMDELKAGNGSGSPPPQGYQFLGPVGARFASGSNVVRAGNTAAIDTAPDGPTPTKELVHLPYSCEPTDEFPNDIYLYSNYNVRWSLSGVFPSAVKDPH